MEVSPSLTHNPFLSSSKNFSVQIYGRDRCILLPMGFFFTINHRNLLLKSLEEFKANNIRDTFRLIPVIKHLKRINMDSMKNMRSVVETVSTKTDSSLNFLMYVLLECFGFFSTIYLGVKNQSVWAICKHEAEKTRI
ncbi:hypothetical protein QVD17_00557 [Tagetes erecta]|uniref:Uncharacterized protein n=1 Tax=Tagetes erecta TaxID=13708 RepID=A0AAD8L5B3_TARER|nr:hypothetical protein QVD17_00557 [Tagetes erecta]